MAKSTETTISLTRLYYASTNAVREAFVAKTYFYQKSPKTHFKAKHKTKAFRFRRTLLQLLLILLLVVVIARNSVHTETHGKVL